MFRDPDQASSCLASRPGFPSPFGKVYVLNPAAGLHAATCLRLKVPNVLTLGLEGLLLSKLCSDAVC